MQAHTLAFLRLRFSERDTPPSATLHPRGREKPVQLLSLWGWRHVLRE